jgi:transposase-like protein
MKQPVSFLQAIEYFSDADRALDYMVKLRWNDGVVTCPTCGRKDPVFLKSQRKWQCKSVHPKRQFTVKVGTIFEDSPISIDKWLVAVWALCNCRNGISSYELHRTLGITQKSAWFMLHRIRLAMKSGSFGKLGVAGGPVEMDETFVGGNMRKMHKSRIKKLNAIASTVRGANKLNTGKTIVHGMLDRKSRQVRASVIPNIKRETLQNLIINNVTKGAEVHTDELPTYKFAMADQYVHEVINHSVEYVSGKVHTNGIENFWSCLKRGLRGTYVAVEPFHLDRYLDEQVFRFNNRKDGNREVSDLERFDRAMHQISGKRLTYAEVTGKVGETIN